MRESYEGICGGELKKEGEELGENKEMESVCLQDASMPSRMPPGVLFGLRALIYSILEK